MVSSAEESKTDLWSSGCECEGQKGTVCVLVLLRVCVSVCVCVGRFTAVAQGLSDEHTADSMNVSEPFWPILQCLNRILSNCCIEWALSQMEFPNLRI